MKQMYEIFQSTDPVFSQVYKEISFIREQFIMLQFTLTKQLSKQETELKRMDVLIFKAFFFLWGGGGGGLSYIRNAIDTIL